MATPIPGNRAQFTVEAILAATGGQVLSTTHQATDAETCLGVITDSRGDVAGKLFVALAGEHFDAHRFVPDVLSRGAFGAVVEQSAATARSGRVIQVASTLDALGNLARAHRRRWGGRLVAIGGSAGKTTTRVAISTLLEHLYPGKIHSTAGNLNNRIGVPMTLLGLEPHHVLAVVEVGTNQPGEVAMLAAACQANIAILTCIGLEHCAGLGDLDGIEAEEGGLFSASPAPELVIGNLDDPRVARQLRRASENPATTVRTFGAISPANYRITERHANDLVSSRLRIQRKLGDEHTELELVTRLFGLPGALATAAAVAVADAICGPSDGKNLSHALDRAVGEVGRLRVVERSDRALVIDDCYNANPVSMRSSIIAAKELAQSRQARIHVVIGDMLELGALSEREHAALAADVVDVDNVVAVGTEVGAMVAQVRQRNQAIAHFATAEQAIDHVRSVTRSGDVVLVKGSRGMRLEGIVSALTGGEGHSP